MNTCEICESTYKLSYRIPDDVWKLLVPKYVQHVCLDCLDALAHKKNVCYTSTLTHLHFTGEGTTYIGFKSSTNKKDLTGIFSTKSYLRRLVRGSIQDYHNTHGPIDRANADSLTRRIVEQIRGTELHAPLQ